MDFNIPTIITKRNTDSNGNPISVKLIELRQVMDNHSCVVLSQIPDELNRVIIEGFTEVFDIEKLDKKNFKVDYSQGIVYFHPFNIGKSLTIEYYGLGYELISVSRIFSYTDKNGRTIETLEEILDRSKLQLDLVESLGGAIKVIEKLDENVKNANNLNNYFDEKIPVATGLKNELDGLVTDAKGWKDQLKQDVADGKILQPKLQKNVEDAKVLQPLLNNDIEVGTPLQENLHSDIVEANKWKDQLHTDIEEGKTLQPLLAETISSGNTTNQQLNQSITNAQGDIAKIEATGNEIINIISSEWVYNETSKMYEKQITHTCNSENVHVTCKTSDTKEGLHLPWKIVDKSNILLKSEEAIGVNVIISARYYKPLTDNTTTQEVIDARKGELTLLDKMNKVDEQLETIETNISNGISADFLRKNKQGLYAVNIVGDSISHGANAKTMYNDSWVGLLRKSLQIEFNTTNYGFINAYGRVSNAVGIFEEYLFISNLVAGWNLITQSDNLGFACRKTDVIGATLKCVAMEYENRKKIGVAVIKDVDGGNLEIKATSTSSKTVTNTYNLNSSSKSHEIIWIDIESIGQLFSLEIKNLNGSNTITGFYLIDDFDNVVLNNYSRSGARIEDLNDYVVDNIFDAEVVIFALGYNRTIDMDTYLNKCKNAFDKYKPKMYVIDFCWDKTRKDISLKLKEFASSLGVPYIRILNTHVDNAQVLVDSGFLSDTSHPSLKGHTIIAEKIMTSLKTSFATRKSIEMFKTQQKTIADINDGVIVYKGRYDITDSNYNLFRDIKMRLEIIINSGSVNNLYLQKFSDGKLYLMADENRSAISKPIANGKGLKTITNGYVENIDISGVIDFADDYTEKIKTLPDNIKIKIIGGIVDNITTIKTNLLDYIKYN